MPAAKLLSGLDSVVTASLTYTLPESQRVSHANILQDILDATEQPTVDADAVVPTIMAEVVSSLPPPGVRVTAKLIFNSGNAYEGQYCDGCMDGEGSYTWKNGTNFIGSFSANKINGHGIYTWANGCRYEGDVKRNLRNGTGFFRMSLGQNYTGTWKDGKIDGQGCVVYSEQPPSQYYGCLHDGVRHGVGTMLYPSGSIYHGNWSRNVRHGHGQMVWQEQTTTLHINSAALLAATTTTALASSVDDMSTHARSALRSDHRRNSQLSDMLGKCVVHTVYEGDWAHGKVHGKGRYIWIIHSNSPNTAMTDKPYMLTVQGTTMQTISSWYPFLNQYDGEFVDGQRDGFGTFLYADGAIYSGEWRCDKKHGSGYYVTPEGRKYDGEWIDDNMVKPFALYAQEYHFDIADLLSSTLKTSSGSSTVSISLPNNTSTTAPLTSSHQGKRTKLTAPSPMEQAILRRISYAVHPLTTGSSTTTLSTTTPATTTTTTTTSMPTNITGSTLAATTLSSTNTISINSGKQSDTSECLKELNNTLRRHVTLLRQLYSKYASALSNAMSPEMRTAMNEQFPHLLLVTSQLDTTLHCTTVVHAFSGMKKEHLWILLRACGVRRYISLAEIDRVFGASYKDDRLHGNRWSCPHDPNHTLTFQEFCSSIIRLACRIYPWTKTGLPTFERGPAGSFAFFIETDVIPRAKRLLSLGFTKTFKTFKVQFGYDVYQIHAKRAVAYNGVTASQRSEADKTMSVREFLLMLKDCDLLAPHTKLTHACAIKAIASHIPLVVQDDCIVLEHELVPFETFHLLFQCFFKEASHDLTESSGAHDATESVQTTTEIHLENNLLSDGQTDTPWISSGTPVPPDKSDEAVDSSLDIHGDLVTLELAAAMRQHFSDLIKRHPQSMLLA